MKKPFTLKSRKSKSLNGIIFVPSDKSNDIVNDEGLNPDVDVDVGIETDDEDSVDEMVEINRDEDQ